MKRREAREKAVQTLFQLDNTELTVDEAIGYITEEPTNRFYEKLVRGTVQNKEAIDEILVGNWKIGHWTVCRKLNELFFGLQSVSYCSMKMFRIGLSLTRQLNCVKHSEMKSQAVLSMVYCQNLMKIMGIVWRN